MNHRERYMRVGEAANETGLHPDTIRTYVDDGLIAGSKLPSGHRLVNREDLQRFCRETFGDTERTGL